MAGRVNKMKRGAQEEELRGQGGQDRGTEHVADDDKV